MISIVKYFEPDLDIIRQHKNTAQWERFSFVFSEGMVIIEQCHEDGSAKNSWSRKYFATRIVNDTVEICVPSLGWIKAYPEINDKYKNQIADKILLEDKL